MVSDDQLPQGTNNTIVIYIKSVLIVKVITSPINKEEQEQRALFDDMMQRAALQLMTLKV